MLNKVSKTLGSFRKLKKKLPRHPLITIYKSFIRTHLDYRDNITYDQVYYISFHQKSESIQYNAALVIPGAISETSRKKLYHKLGSASLESKKWYRKLCCFYKVFKTQSRRYLFVVILTVKRARNDNKLPHFKVKHNCFKNSFFPATVLECKKLDLNIPNSGMLHKSSSHMN